MGQSLSHILLHIVFSTKKRLPFIDSEIEPRLYRYIQTIAQERDCPIHEIGGVADHVHILCSLSRSVPVSKFVQEIKANSSKWLRRLDSRFQQFAWQSGYGAFSVSKSNQDTVKTYVRSQKEHHRQKSFQEEYLSFLKKHEIEFDLKYVWD
jgi:putative transposase